MNRNYPAVLLALFALLISAGVVGCGGDESAEAGDESVEATLTLPQYQRRANFICNRASSEAFQKAGIYLSKHSDDGTEAEMYEQAGLPPLEKALRELQNLPVPEEIESGIQAFLEEFEGAIEEARKDPELIVAEPNPFDKARKLGRKYRLGDCGIIP